MESLNDSAVKAVSGKKVMVQGLVDRDLYGQFRDLCGSHRLTLAQGIAWGMRSLLTAAGVRVRADRGGRGQNATDGGGALQLAENHGESHGEHAEN